jgi:carboxypeptidase C (cathepsin A)
MEMLVQFRVLAVAAACIALLAVNSVQAAAPDATAADGLMQAVTTNHTGVFNGKTVAYQASVEPIVVNDAAGKPGARVVGISYIASSVADSANRPVLFAFNGGPISPSNVLHMGMLGPKRVAIPDDVSANPSTFKLVENPYTLLDVADIVFIDPASTGFSRVLKGVDPKSYFSVHADAQQVAQFIVEWSKQHGRLASPKYVLGESYGTMRAAAVANQLQKLPQPVPLSGVILLGQALNIIEFSQRPANAISYVVSLPTLAAIAWSHGKANSHGKSFDAFMDDVWSFARNDYLTALFQGQSLDPDQRRAIAGKLADFTGLSADYYVAHDLQISKESYRRELLRDKGEILGQIDARYAGPNDGHSGDPAGVITKAYDAEFKVYLRDDLGIANADAYITDGPVKGFGDWEWDGTGTSPFADWPYPRLLSEVFAANPNFRLMIGNGYEDTQTTVGAARYLINRSDWPRDRVSLHFYQGGHTTYSVEDSLRRMTDDIRAMIATR